MNEEVENLLDFYLYEYLSKYGKEPQLNRYRDLYGFAAMLHDYAYPECTEIIQYFFKTGGDHSTSRLFQNYDGLRKSKEESDKDRRRLEKLMKETAERVKKWEREHPDYQGME